MEIFDYFVIETSGGGGASGETGGLRTNLS